MATKWETNTQALVGIRIEAYRQTTEITNFSTQNKEIRMEDNHWQYRDAQVLETVAGVKFNYHSTSALERERASNKNTYHGRMAGTTGWTLHIEHRHCLKLTKYFQ